jgi:hypothetical protein
MRLRPAALGLWLLLAQAAAAAEPPRVAVRTGTHADFGRIVFDWPSPVDYSVEQAGDVFRLRFASPAEIDLARVARGPRNVAAVEREGETIVIRAVPGARLRHFRLGNRVVLDLMDAEAPAAPVAARPRPRPRPLAPPAAVPRPSTPADGRATAGAAPPAPVPAVQPAAEARPAPAPAAAPVPASAPAPEVRAPAADPPAPSPVALPAPEAIALIPLHDRPGFTVATDAGIALLRRGDRVMVVFDRELVLDPAPLRGHPVLGGTEVLPAGEGTLLRLPLAPPARLAARREGNAWVIEATREEPAADAPVLRSVAEAGPPARLVVLGGLTDGAAGGAIALADPDTGEKLLVGTLRRPGAGMPVGRRLPELELLPTMMGVVVLARSDRVRMRPLADRIIIEAAGGASLALGAAGGREPPAQAMAMSRLMDLPDAPVPALLERLRLQLTTLNETPPLARGPARRAAAETLLALGLPQEAQAMAGLALREDPDARRDARLLLVQGAAALLAGRIGEARGIAEERLPENDEVALWRGLLAAAEGDPAAATALVAVAPLLLAYPEALRRRLLPLAAETLAAGGEAAQAARLIAAAGEEPGLDLARAMVAEAEGRIAEALAAYGAIAAGRDRRARAIALRRATELRLAQGMIDAGAAAAQLEAALPAWRGGAEELALRRRVAELRLAANQGEAAFAMLEETARLFPAAAEALRPALQEAFVAALETAAPAAAATLFDAHPDLMPDGERGEAIVLLLADRLAALDLPQRAAALLERAAARATGAAKAAIGARLAALHAAEGNNRAVLAALDSTEAVGLDEALRIRRGLLRANALARLGDRAAAETLLAGLGPAGAAARAELRAEARDWPAAAMAQMEFLGAAVPPPPAPIEAAQRAALVRAAAYAALAGDEALLDSLRATYGARMAEGPLAEAFALLTSDPLRGIADLPRLQREIGWLRALPSRLEALRAGVQVTR